MRAIMTLILPIFLIVHINAEISLEECISKAKENYPLIKKYDLISSTSEIELSEINKNWLPRIGLFAQGTAQNIVPSYPDALNNILQQMGQNPKGLGKLQYKIGVEINQPVWDGGASRAKRNLALAKENLSKASLEVELYAISQHVQKLYFAILLTEAQISQREVTLNLLKANEERLESMIRNGIATKSDGDMIKAQILELKQSILRAESSVTGLKKMLSLFIDEPAERLALIIPEASVPISNESARPELQQFNKRILLSQSIQNLSDVGLMPKIGFFAQTYYGYPGFDYFKSMLNRNLSFNILAGVKISWNIDSFYTRKDGLKRRNNEIANIETERETFIFNNDQQIASKREEIEGIKKLMVSDSEIIELRKAVRMTAESKLKNGIIDPTTLLATISDEESARLNSKFHEIQLYQLIYELKNILNQ